MAAHLVALAQKRVRSVLQEIDRIASSEFPNEAARDALARIRELFVEHQDTLQSIDDPSSDPAVIDVVCQDVLTNLAEYLPLLGFILRSTNVRNAFELHAPLTRLCRQVVDSNSRLVLSSEWEYSPLIFMEAPRLEEFVFIGFPAHESGNPFILPLAGHELGHAAWHRDANALWRISFERALEQQIVIGLRSNLAKFRELYPDHQKVKPDELANDWVVQQTWAPAFEWAKKQSEEYFCDLFGIRIFGESFLHAFSYLLSPSMHGERPVYYPNFGRRIKAQMEAAKVYGINVPTDYENAFGDLMEPDDVEAHKKFLVGLADLAADHLVDQLIQHVESLLSMPTIKSWKVANPKTGTLRKDGTPEPPNIPHPQIEESLQRIQRDFFDVAPAEDSGGLALLLNAAWSVLQSNRTLNGIGDDEKEPVLREILLKSIEAFEYETRIANAYVVES